MTEDELRGFLLRIFYDRRHNAGGRVPISDMVGGHAGISREMIASACRHLADGGLTKWEPLVGEREGVAVGIGEITGYGVDVVHGLATPTIAITLPADAERARGADSTDNFPLRGINPTRIANWERYGVDAIEADLIHSQGTAYVGGPPEIREQAQRWVRYKREQARAKEPEVFSIKPNVYGVGIDVKAAVRKIRGWWKSQSK